MFSTALGRFTVRDVTGPIQWTYIDKFCFSNVWHLRVSCNAAGGRCFPVCESHCEGPLAILVLLASFLPVHNPSYPSQHQATSRRQGGRTSTTPPSPAGTASTLLQPASRSITTSPTNQATGPPLTPPPVTPKECPEAPARGIGTSPSPTATAPPSTPPSHSIF